MMTRYAMLALLAVIATACGKSGASRKAGGPAGEGPAGVNPDVPGADANPNDGTTPVVADKNPDGDDPEAEPDVKPPTPIGVRDYLQYPATLSAITGIPLNNQVVAAELTSARGALPQSNNIENLGVSTQKAMFTISAAFCIQAINNAQNRQRFLGNVDLRSTDQVADTLMEKFFLVTGAADYAADPTLTETRAKIAAIMEEVRGLQAANVADVNAAIGGCISAAANGRMAVL